MAQSDTPLPLKIIAGADNFGCPLKDALVTHLRSLSIDVDDLGVGPYYSIGADVARRVASSSTTTTIKTIGLVTCGTGVGVQIFANKIPGIYAAACLSPSDAVNARSINNANVLSLSGKSTSPESAVEILNTFLNTPFKAPCPANDNQSWPPDVQTFLDNSLAEMCKIGNTNTNTSNDTETEKCTICCLVKDREFVPVDIMPGGMMRIVRESPTSAVVRFKAGSVEPAHHHTFGHDVVVMEGRKRVWNVSKGGVYDLGVGDYLFTPAGDVHRVKYFEDTEFFIKWDGHWDIFLDEDLETAKAALDKEV